MMKYVLTGVALMLGMAAAAQTFTAVTSTEGREWKESKVRLERNAVAEPALVVDGSEAGTPFYHWGHCFNELAWDALCMLPEADREELLHRMFAPDGDLRFTMGRIPMNANDYARSWYSCDEVAGDFELRYFSIDRDRQAIIPFIRAAQKHVPGMTFWASPWCPPSWMKINADYPVRSDRKYNTMDARKDYLLYGGAAGDRDDYKAPTGKTFPDPLSHTDYMIQDPRYLQAYADYFCRFVSEYAAEGIKIGMVMFQNEAWSYTPYPGCAWTPEGIIRFNVKYLVPTMRREHPEVDVFFGTINTNRFNIIDRVLSDTAMAAAVRGVGLQWEGGQLLPGLRKKYPGMRFVQTESECGWGSFDWRAAEHTFERINHYLGNGCEDYTFWNAVLADNGMSTWGWKQNALVRVDSKKRTFTLTPEYYAVSHYTRFVPKGSRIVGFVAGGKQGQPVLVARTPGGKLAVMAGNFADSERTVTLRIGKKYLNMAMAPHSLNTFAER